MNSNNTNHHYHHNQHLGVKKLGKNIRKSPLHHTPSFPSSSSTRPPQHQPSPPLPPPPQQPNQPPQPLVYNISKNEFRSIVQQLTGTPSRDPSPAPPPRPIINNNPLSPAPPPNPNPSPNPNPINKHHNPTSNRLQRIRPPPLAPIARPALPRQPPPNPNPTTNFRLPSPLFTPSPLSNPMWPSAGESPVSAYMRYLENSIVNAPPQPPQQQHQQQQQQPGLLPTPPPNTALQQQHQQQQHQQQLQQGFPSPLMPSPSSFLNLLSPRSTHPILSPNFQFTPPLSPSLLGSPFPQTGGGILGPGPQQPPPSPGVLFPPSPLPLSPSAFLLSPRWRNM